MATTEMMKGLVAEGMLQALSQEKRDELVRSAIANLLEPQRNQYGSAQPSLLEQAFRGEATSLATEIIREEVTKNPEVREKVRAAVLEAFEKFFASTELADAMVAGLWKVFRDR